MRKQAQHLLLFALSFSVQNTSNEEAIEEGKKAVPLKVYEVYICWMVM